MGTRSGDLDPAILDHVASKEGYSAPEIEGILNKQSGLLGVSGLTNDMRELFAEEAEHGDRRARLAIDIFAYRARKYIGSYLGRHERSRRVDLRRRHRRKCERRSRPYLRGSCSGWASPSTPNATPRW